MEWLLPVSLRILCASVVYPLLLKGKIVQNNLAKRFFLQYFLCAIFAAIFALTTDQFKFPKEFWIMYTLGIFIGLGTYCNWLTNKLNLSATSLFLVFDDVLAIALGFVFLHEVKYLNSTLLVGLIICLIGVALYSYSNYQKKRDPNSPQHLPMKFFLYVATFSIIWGVAIFSQRYYATQKLPIATFLLGWYFGTFTAATIICFKNLGFFQLIRELRTTTKKKELALMALSAAIIMLNIVVGYWAMKLAPLAVVQPIFYISDLIIPLLIGLFIFKEKRDLNRLEILSFCLGATGALVIGISFSLSLAQ